MASQMASQMVEDKYIETLQKLKENIGDDNKDIDDIIKYINKQKMKSKKFISQTENFKNKIEMVLSFIKYLDSLEMSSTMCIYGSFVRNLIEKIFVSGSDIIGYADPLNHDIDIAIYSDSYYYDSEKSKFSKLIESLQTLTVISKLSGDSIKNYCFGKYKLVSVINKTITDDRNIRNDENKERAEPGFIRKLMTNVPHYNLIFKHNEFPDDIIKIDLLAYKEIHNNTWGDEFDVNSLKLTMDGIGNTKYNFFDILDSILNKRAICNIDFEQNMSSITSSYVVRSEKEGILNQIMHFLTHRIKILDLGYTDIYSKRKFFDITVERESNCDITGNEPPYIKIKLECNHELSLMAIAGLINIRGSDYTEAINCPLCRQSLKFKLIDKLPLIIEFPQIEFKSEYVEIPDYERNYCCNSIDNTNYISGVMHGLSLKEINEFQDTHTTAENTNEQTPHILDAIRNRMREQYPL
jgi:hypothetical protein